MLFVPLCQQARTRITFRKENSVLGLENDAHENERFNLGFQALSFARASPQSFLSVVRGARLWDREAPRAAGRLRVGS